MRADKILTNISVILGVLAALSCFSINLLFYGLLCTIAGTISSIFVIFLRTKWLMDTKWTHPAMLALFLNSIPVIYLIIIIFIFKNP